MTNVFSNLVATLVAIQTNTNVWTEPSGVRYERLDEDVVLAAHLMFNGRTFAFSNLYSVPIITNRYVWTLAPMGTNVLPVAPPPPAPFVLKTNLLATNTAPMILSPVQPVSPLIMNRGR